MSRLKQKQTQRQSLSPQQVIQANILQLNISALETKILDELESNPVLDQSLENEHDSSILLLSTSKPSLFLSCCMNNSAR